ncbi:MAG: diguanylate cyclase domain-containing protein [Solirubrobacterales bacterium]
MNLRELFAARPDPYAGGDLENARRLGVFLWLLGIALTVGLLPFSQPTAEVGGAGWVLAWLLVASACGVAYALHVGWLRSWEGLLVSSYASVLGVSAMQWLSGGVEAPYQELLLLPVGFVAAIQPPRRVAVFLLIIALALAAPFVYDHWEADAVGAAAATYVIWCGLAVAVNVLMSGVRGQRISLAHDEARARQEARLDPLTGLNNRRAFNEMLEVEVNRARSGELPLCVAMVDLVNFKEINERWSYTEGDRCLQRVASTLRTSLRDPDLLFRWGGDEFALVLNGTSAEGARAVAERLSAEVDAACRRPDGEPITIRFAAAELERGMAIHQLVERAGLALTAAKSRG